MRRALVIEDSPEYQMLLSATLKDRFEFKVAADAGQAIAALAITSYDLILIDVGLPGRDGVSLCEELRRDVRLAHTPIMFVTGHKETSDIVSGFAAGADDYIHKPFHPDELRARIEARLKRHSNPSKHEDSFWKGGLHFFVGRQSVVKKDSTANRDLDLTLTPNEFKILYYLARNEGKTVSRADILREVWGENLHVIERTVDKHICSLRRKLVDSSRMVASVPGEGYVFNSDMTVPRIRKGS